MPRISTLRITRSHKIATAVLVAAGSVTAIAATGGASEAQTPQARSSISVEPVAAAGIPTAKDAAAKKAAEATAAKEAAAKKAAAEKDATEARSEKQAANRSTERKAVTPKKFANNLDGWIRESLDIMKKKNIPGSYEGLHRNIMRESSGNPNAVNDWDINARNGIPSKGLLQVIQPTFDAYHVKGTPKKLTDPVANITAAANYAADRYGSIDNVDSAY
ncbi:MULTISPECIES: transglycosylase SLT domain-containing protein [Streptomyces]|uniref:Transglycosylase SLT domain-containing protein n=1 Tax=Streptomyces caviscabies TaxID=90079 RepID=A0ABW2MI94_9ACTN|nr:MULTISPECIES: transglycosylase SLT domain-containing protein [unclassified Streptomyces]MDX3340530.1 transglycosylase SLT domain-containing protein [Streptomyces sp. ME02-6979.5a]MDX3503830.1 transglycosylase SLT domain-containing protein [Streptomyces sp. ATCC51928]MDX5525798.1 transglycosylase SLT domain-containing protein [Streptomyces sp. DE06-01C]